jgi:hypothetical protein
MCRNMCRERVIICTCMVPFLAQQEMVMCSMTNRCPESTRNVASCPSVKAKPKGTWPVNAGKVLREVFSCVDDACHRFYKLEERTAKIRRSGLVSMHNLSDGI